MEKKHYILVFKLERIIAWYTDRTRVFIFFFFAEQSSLPTFLGKLYLVYTERGATNTQVSKLVSK